MRLILLQLFLIIVQPTWKSNDYRLYVLDTYSASYDASCLNPDLTNGIIKELNDIEELCTLSATCMGFVSSRDGGPPYYLCEDASSDKTNNHGKTHYRKGNGRYLTSSFQTV